MGHPLRRVRRPYRSPTQSSAPPAAHARRVPKLQSMRRATRSCARGSATAVASCRWAAALHRRASARSPSWPPTRPGPCSSPCAPRSTARAPRSSYRDSPSTRAPQWTRSSAARSARRNQDSTACRASRRAAAGSDRSPSTWRPYSCGRHGWSAARSRLSAECRRSHPRRDASRAARIGARTRSATPGTAAALRRTRYRTRASTYPIPTRRSRR